jgi:hypothetical protein
MNNNDLLSRRTSSHLDLSSPIVDYPVIKKKSSQIKLSPKEGIIIKTKRRNPNKVIYEFLSLEVWSRLLADYSIFCNLQFSSPSALGYDSLSSESPNLYMSFLNGIPFKKLGQFKSNEQVFVPRFGEKVGLFEAAAFYLGALNEIKEKESLLHSDYDDRHLHLNLANPSIGIVDVENSKIDSPLAVKKESACSFEGLIKHTDTRKSFSHSRISDFYSKGTYVVRSLDTDPFLSSIIDEVKEKYHINFDFKEKTIESKII